MNARRAAHWVWALLLTALAVSVQARDTQVLHGVVADVHDGDTLTVEDRTGQFHTIRVNGIDAPELKQPYGKAARDAMRTLVLGKSVQVEIIKLDRYGRYIGKVLRADNTDVGLELLRQGLAWWFERYATDQSPADRSI